jgi:hypothetical protein
MAKMLNLEAKNIVKTEDFSILGKLVKNYERKSIKVYHEDEIKPIKHLINSLKVRYSSKRFQIRG